MSMNITCEVCGNDFNKGKYATKKFGELFIACPYCGHENKKVSKQTKQRGARK